MTDYKGDRNNVILQKAIEALNLRFPVAEIVQKTGYNKGNISGYINNKKPVSENFLNKFFEKFNLNRRDFDENNSPGKNNTSETKNKPSSLNDFSPGEIIKHIINNTEKFEKTTIYQLFKENEINKAVLLEAIVIREKLENQFNEVIDKMKAEYYEALKKIKQ